MASILQPVGRGVPNTNQNDVKLVQSLLNQHRPPPLAPISADGKVGPKTIAAIEEFQRRVVGMPVPDGRVDPGGTTFAALVCGAALQELVSLVGTGGPFFPFPKLPGSTWTSAPRAFGSDRNGGKRAHAGCDLYFPVGTWIYAIQGGEVVRDPYPFYCQTDALEVDHGDFLVRYGEIKQGCSLKKGDPIVGGKKIAQVGHLVGIHVPSAMLHVEMYSKKMTGSLSVGAAFSKKRSDGVPFMRRGDLIDPTPYLNQWKTSLAVGY